MNNKRGVVGLIILGVIGFVVLMLIVAGVYFYNFYVFKTVRICVGEGNNTGYTCEVVQDCVDAAGENGISFDLNSVPDFLRGEFESVLDDVVYCDSTCFVKEIRGINSDTLEITMLDSCNEDEDEFAVDIRGKEGLEILKYLKSLNDEL